MNNLLVFCASVVIVSWGIFHLVPTKRVIKYFGNITQEQRYILTMEWIAEGLTLIFIGLLVFFITLLTSPGNQIVMIMYRFCSGMLIIMAGVTFFTGARTSITPIKICPLVKTFTATLIMIGSF